MSEAPRFIVVDADTDSQSELYATVNSRLLEEEAVRDSFLDAVSAREKKYPTGLDFGHCQVAIPHIDPDHVITPGVLVCRNAQQTPFRAMDDPDRELSVRLSIWPLVTDPHNQMDMLGAVISLLQEDSSCQRLLTADPTELPEILADVMKAVGQQE
ncbi:PTS fructose transporter subunit IIA [Acidipropionibacterium jensenii]|uniref:PTS fructose transporter subunit IIA n=1 Tax=Acidipropionibacterium jensenii TaxID=1749 RepID=A0A3T0S154_9ACTN|nr:PTS sugar transporter subunit IIA [Acidipropionibacterium jensenii]AZZ40089.1 PTS fructose transporter subunit IIA [Acidipropionibacterium jensenii]